MNKIIVTELLLKNDILNLKWVEKIENEFASISIIEVIQIVKKNIKQYYKKNNDACNAYSKMGYYLLSKNIELEQAFRLFNYDAELNKQTWFFKLRHAECIAALGKKTEASEMVKNVYKMHPEAVNGYAAIAYHLKDCKELISSPLHYCQYDILSKRLSAGFMLNVAELAISENAFADAEKLIKEAYEKDSTLTDGYARCAWGYYKPIKEYSKLIEWMNKDKGLDKLSPKQQCNLAEIYALNGDIEFAKKEIEEAYEKDSTLTDGYARCAWGYYKPIKEYSKLIEWMSKDKGLDKLSPKQQCNLAEMYALNGDIEFAKKEIEEAYEKDSTLTDGYARCAWGYYLTRGEFIELKKLCEFEVKLMRSSSNGNLLYVNSLYLSKDWEKAKQVIEACYMKDKSLFNWHASLASLKVYNMTPSPDELYKLDLDNGRLDKKGVKEYFYFLVQSDRLQEALLLAEERKVIEKFDAFKEVELTINSMGYSNNMKELLLNKNDEITDLEMLVYSKIKSIVQNQIDSSSDFKDNSSSSRWLNTFYKEINNDK